MKIVRQSVHFCFETDLLEVQLFDEQGDKQDRFSTKPADKAARSPSEMRLPVDEVSGWECGDNTYGRFPFYLAKQIFSLLMPLREITRLGPHFHHLGCSDLCGEDHRILS